MRRSGWALNAASRKNCLMRHRRRGRGSNQTDAQQAPAQGDVAADPGTPAEEQNAPVSPAADLITAPAVTPYDVETESAATISAPTPPTEAETSPPPEAAVPEAPAAPPAPEPVVSQVASVPQHAAPEP